MQITAIRPIINNTTKATATPITTLRILEESLDSFADGLRNVTVLDVRVTIVRSRVVGEGVATASTEDLELETSVNVTWTETCGVKVEDNKISVENWITALEAEEFASKLGLAVEKVVAIRTQKEGKINDQINKYTIN